MFYIMQFKEYIRRLQNKPEHQRRRIAIIATAVSFGLVLIVWLVSFSEMNKKAREDREKSSQSLEELEGLKEEFGEGKKSIQEMFERLPSDGGADTRQEYEFNSEGENYNDSDRRDLPENENEGQDSKKVPELP